MLDPKSETPPPIGQVRLAALIALVLGAAVYVGAQARAGGSENTITSQPDKAGSLEATLFVKCEFSSYPTSFPNNGTIYAVIMWNVNEWGGITRLFAPESVEFKILERTKFLPTYRCEVVNYGAVPLFNVAMVLTVNYREAINTGDHSQTSGNAISTNERVLEIDKLDLGPAALSTHSIFTFSILPINSSKRAFHQRQHFNFRMTLSFARFRSRNQRAT